MVSNKYNKWELDQGKSALQDLDSLAAIFENEPFDGVTLDVSHPDLGDFTFTPDGTHQPRCVDCFNAFGPNTLATTRSKVDSGGKLANVAGKTRGSCVLKSP